MNAVSISQEIGVMFNMSKVMLVMDEPKNCGKCPCFMELSTDFCSVTNEDVSPYGKRPESCPLRPVPEKKEIFGAYNGEYYKNSGKPPSWKCGYNACIDEILKE